MSNYQSQTFRQLSEYLDGGISLCSFVSDCLQIGRSTAYKKINGTSSLSLEEFFKLVHRGNIPIGSLSQITGHAMFQIDGIKRQTIDPLDYFRVILHHLGHLTTEDNITFTYLSQEIPFYHLLNFPHLTSLKLFVWEVTNWNGQKRTTSLDLDNQHANLKAYNRVRTQLLDYYLQCPGVEIWKSSILDSTIEQIIYLLYSGLIKDRSTIDRLVRSLENLYTYLYDSCTSGYKINVNNPEKNNLHNIEVYYNSIVNTGNTIIIKGEKTHRVYTMLDTPNYLNTSSNQVTDHISAWVDNIIVHSTKISREGNTARRNYFRKLRMTLDQGLKEINQLIRRQFD